jgi:hypothetical protein
VAHLLMGAGVVVQKIQWNNHPVCAVLVAYAASLDRAATPPVQEGQSAARPRHTILPSRSYSILPVIST